MRWRSWRSRCGAPRRRAPSRCSTSAQGSAPSAVTDAAGTLHVVWRTSTSRRARSLSTAACAAGGAAAPRPARRARRRRRPTLLLRPQDGALIAVFSALDDALGDVTTCRLGRRRHDLERPGHRRGRHGLDRRRRAHAGRRRSSTPSRSRGSQVLFQRVPVGGAPSSGSCRWAPTRLAPAARDPSRRRPARRRRRTTPTIASERAWRPWAPTRRAGLVGAPGAWRSLAGADASAADAGPTGTWLLATIATARAPARSPCASGAGAPAGSSARARSARSRSAAARRRRRAGPPTTTSRSTSTSPGACTPRGRWRQQACGGQQCIVYRRTDRRGFGPPIVYPLGPALRRRHRSASRSPPTAAAAAGWCGTTSPIASAPCRSSRPPLGSRVGSRRIGRLRVTVPDFYGCVPSGGRFVHRLRLDGRRGTAIVSVRFFFDAGQPARIDRRAPWRTSFRLTFAPGTRHVAAAIVRYRLPGRARCAARGSGAPS